mgnify:CR=1 FL=1
MPQMLPTCSLPLFGTSVPHGLPLLASQISLLTHAYFSFCCCGQVTRETESAIAAMEKESEGLLKSLDAQAEKISSEVLKRVLPEGVKV